MTNHAAPAADTFPIRHDAGPVAIVIHAHPNGVYSVHIHSTATGAEHNHLRRTWDTWDAARAMANNAYRHFANGGGVDIPAAPAVKLAPPAQSTATKVTDPGLAALDHAIAAGGHIARGGHEGQASVTLLQALAKRRHVDLVVEMHGRRKVITGARITRAGRIAHLRAIGAHKLTYALSA